MTILMQDILKRIFSPEPKNSPSQGIELCAAYNAIAVKDPNTRTVSRTGEMLNDKMIKFSYTPINESDDSSPPIWRGEGG